MKIRIDFHPADVHTFTIPKPQHQQERRMTATLTNAAQRGTAAPKPRKTRKASSFMILPGDVPYLGEASSLKDARKQIAEMVDGIYIVVSRRGKFTVGTETAKVVKASK